MTTSVATAPGEREAPGLDDRFGNGSGEVGEYLVKVPLAKGISATVSIEAEEGRVIRPSHIDRLAEYLKLARASIDAEDDDNEAPE